MDKSAYIRKLLAEQPHLTPKEIQAALGSQGVEVTRNLCKVVRHRLLNAEKAVDSSERPLRDGEARIGHAITRLSEKDFVIWDLIKSYVEALDENVRDRELHMHGGPIERLPEVREWLGAVSTWRARDRRRRILKRFLDDLRAKYPQLPPAWMRSTDKKDIPQRSSENVPETKVKSRNRR